MTHFVAHRHSFDIRGAAVTLGRAPGVGGVAVQKLLETFGSAKAAVAASKAALRGAGLTSVQADAIKQPDADGIAADLAWLDLPQRHLLTLVDDAYPKALRDIAQPPPEIGKAHV